MHRAAHQIIEKGNIFCDPLAVRILVGDAITSSSTRLRRFIAWRSRFAEDRLAAAVDGGVTQLVVLGAGLDTFAYRSPYGERLRVFEVDHPSTQAWKRARLAAAGISEPPWLTFAPVDFERQGLADGLAASGFDGARQTFFTWLGVTPYLTEEAVWSTLRFIASLPGGAHVVFDYAKPPGLLDAETRAEYEIRAARVARIGEAFLSSFRPEELCAGLRDLGFTLVEESRHVVYASRSA